VTVELDARCPFGSPFNKYTLEKAATWNSDGFGSGEMSLVFCFIGKGFNFCLPLNWFCQGCGRPLVGKVNWILAFPPKMVFDTKTLWEREKYECVNRLCKYRRFYY
jgi:hypothetical protein